MQQVHNTAKGVINLCARIRERANSRISARLAEAGIEKIAPAHGGIFFHLFGGGELPMNEIAARIHRDKSTVTALVNKLVALGYAQKRKSDEDSRVTLVRLTEKGEALAPLFRDITDELLGRSYAGFSPEEQQTLASLLGRLLGNLE